MEQKETSGLRADLGLFVGAFFDALMRAGVRDVVVSPGSRSTPLAMVAHEASMRPGKKLNLYVDVDERGAAFFALGLAKATGRAVCVVCTSGTALANYYPAIMEAESSRVPLVVLSGDRPARLQGLGAPQTCDQAKVYSDHVKRYIGMPEPSAEPARLRHARQMAREALIAAAPGTHDAGPVHVNFPFDEPLVPDVGQEELFDAGCMPADGDLPFSVEPERLFDPYRMLEIAEYLDAKRVVVLAGEGTFSCEAVRDHARRDREAQALLAFSERFDAPLLADPLSQLRCYGHPAVISGYDRIMGSAHMPAFDVAIRFGRYPVSKRATQAIAAVQPAQIVVDARETRDFNAQTTTFVAADPLDFVTALLESAAVIDARTTPAASGDDAPPARTADQALPSNVQAWALLDRERIERLAAADLDGDAAFEGAYVKALMEEMPSETLLFTANSMSVRAVDEFYSHQGKRLTVLANRGLNGIDGTVSTAIGAAQSFKQTVFLTGDLTMLHDLNALALQGEMQIREQAGHARPSITVVLLNNSGGGIFEMLPQRSDEAYFERLFETPHRTDFQAAARAFGVPARRVSTVAEFRAALGSSWGVPGITLIEVPGDLKGLKERYARYR